MLKAEALIVRALKEEGRPLAKITGREIVADHATSTLDVTLTVAAGPVAGYGETTVEGTEKVDRDFTEYMTGLKRGRQYSPDEIDDARDRLLGLEVFNSVTLKEADASTPTATSRSASRSASASRAISASAAPSPTPKGSASKAIGATAICSAGPKSCASTAPSAASAATI